MKVCSKFHLPTVFQSSDIGPHSDYKKSLKRNIVHILCTSVCWTFLRIRVSGEHILNFIFLQCFKDEIWIPNFEYLNVHFNLYNHSSVTILIIHVYVFNRKKHSKLYLPHILNLRYRDPKPKNWNLRYSSLNHQAWPYLYIMFTHVRRT